MDMFVDVSYLLVDVLMRKFELSSHTDMRVAAVYGLNKAVLTEAGCIFFELCSLVVRSLATFPHVSSAVFVDFHCNCFP